MRVSKSHKSEAVDRPVGDKGSGEVNSGTKTQKTQRHNKHIGGIIYIAILLFSIFLLILPAYRAIKEVNDVLDRINNPPTVYSSGDKVIVDRAEIN